MHTYVVSECLKLLKMTEGKDSSTVRSCLSRDHWSKATKRGLSSPPSPAAPLWEEIKGKMNRTCSGQPAPSWWRGPHLLDFQWALSPLITGPHQAVQASISGRCGPWVCGAELPPSVRSRPLAFCPLGQSVRESGQAPASAKDLLQLWASVSPLPTRLLSTRHLFNIETNGERGGWCQSNQRIL